MSVFHLDDIERGIGHITQDDFDNLCSGLELPDDHVAAASASIEWLKSFHERHRERMPFDKWSRHGLEQLMMIIDLTQPDEPPPPITISEEAVVTVSLFSEGHYKSLLDDPSELLRLTDEQFEQLVLDRFSAMGLDCRQVGTTRRKDGGVDIVAWPENPVEFPYIIAAQVKHHRSTRRKTGVVPVRNMHGVVTAQGSQFHFGVVVTNTSFTADAKWFANRNSKLLRLRGLLDLQRWMQNDFADSSVKAEIPDRLELGLGVEIEIPKKEIWLPGGNTDSIE